MGKTLTVKATDYNKRLLSNCVSAGPKASIKGMRKHFWGDSLIVKCGSYIYKVQEQIWNNLK